MSFQSVLKKQLKHTERFNAYGYPPEKKKADFLFALHMLASLRSGGIMATVMPHGVLFRGSGEYDIRKKLVHQLLNEFFIFFRTCSHHPPSPTNQITFGIFNYKPFTHIFRSCINSKWIRYIPVIVEVLITIKNSGSTNI